MLGILHVTEEVGEMDDARQVGVCKGNTKPIIEDGITGRHKRVGLSVLQHVLENLECVVSHTLGGEVLTRFLAAFDA